MQQGWISLHRKIMEHPLYREKRKFSKLEAWVDLLLMANHKDNKFMLGNELVEVKKGSFITSELKLMERWDWGKSKVRSFLELLEEDGMIIKKSDRKKTTITICNYCVYQDSEIKNRPRADREQTTSRPRADTNNNDNNEINKNIVQNDLFERWWNLYGNKKGKVKCQAKFNQLLKKYDFTVIENGTNLYLQHLTNLKAKGEFVPQQKNPLTFLNGEHFNDEYETIPSKQAHKPVPRNYVNGLSENDILSMGE